MISELVQRVFATRDAAHRQHWKTKSYAEHVALSKFYEELIDAIDSVVENYIGQFGQFSMAPGPSVAFSDFLQHLQEESDWIESNRDEIAQGSNCIGNQVDTLTAIYTRTIFLLGMK